MHVYRWDLDKTYLDTDFDSIRGLMRSATEPAVAKRATPGATALARALCAHPRNKLRIVSGSPTQMREVLSEKLRLDGIRYDELVLKDSLKHLRKGQVRAIRGQFGYKLPALLRSRVGLGRGVHETLFGDDAEVDALVYSVYADAISGRLRPAQVARILEAAGAYRESIDETMEVMARVSVAEAVERIFIRIDRGVPPARFEVLGTRVIPVHSWWQGALVLLEAGHIDGVAASEVLKAVVREAGHDVWAIAGLTQDLVLRGRVGAQILDQVQDADEFIDHCTKALKRLGTPPVFRPAAPPDDIDYLAVVRNWSRHR